MGVTLQVAAPSFKRSLPFRMRPDVLVGQQRHQGRTYWVIEDPLRLKYFRLPDEGFMVLSWLDGQCSLEDIQARFENRFQPQSIQLRELQQFIAMLHRSGLLLADACGQAAPLLARRAQRRRREVIGKFTNPLAVHFRGIDPGRLLERLHPLLGWAFRWPAVVGGCLSALAALLLVTVNVDVCVRKLPAYHDFFNLQNAFWLLLVIAVTKVAHEFGHGLACEHFGAQCHELGVMLLLFTPSLYCNVSDSWMLPNKWHRAAIAAAGMYVELGLATAATFVWWFSEPGLIHYLAFNVMLVCSISTVLFNGNPLLQYDGYYILADVMEVPNLREKAGRALNQTMSRLCLGLPVAVDPMMPVRHRYRFIAYSLAAIAYRWFVLAAILLFLYSFLKPYRLEIVGQAIALLVINSILLRPMVRAIQFMRVPGRSQMISKTRLLVTGCLLLLVAAGILFVPVPYHVYSAVEVVPHQATMMYVEVPGQLTRIHVLPGQQVTIGQPVATLVNHDLQLAVEKLHGTLDGLKQQRDSLRTQQFVDIAAAGMLPRLNESIAAVEQQLADRQMELERLVLRAPADGTVLPLPAGLSRHSAQDDVPTWTGNPLDNHNLGNFLTAGMPLCRVGQANRVQAVLMIDQSEISFIELGQPVELKLDALPAITLRSTIRELAVREVLEAGIGASQRTGGALVTRTDSTGKERPENTSYEARAWPLDDQQEFLISGMRGRAKIRTGSQTLAEVLRRLFDKTFRFRL